MELNPMCKTDEKTRQNYLFTARRNVLQKLRKLALRKHMHMMSSLLTLNQIQQYFILVL